MGVGCDEQMTWWWEQPVGRACSKDRRPARAPHLQHAGLTAVAIHYRAFSDRGIGKRGGHVSAHRAGQERQKTRKKRAAGMAAQETTEHFRKLGAGSFQPRLRGITGIGQINIEGAGVWRAATNDGIVTLTEARMSGPPSEVDAVVSCSAEDFVRILRHEGDLNIHSALLQGLVAVSGDVVIAAALLRSTMVDCSDFRS